MEAAPAYPVLDPLVGALDLAVALAVAFVGSRRPVTALAALIVIEPFALYRYVGGTTLTLPKAALLGAIAGVLVAAGSQAGKLFAPERHPAGAVLATAIVCFTAATALTYWHAAEHVPVIRETLKWVEYLAVFGLAAGAFALDPDEDAIALALTTIVTIVSLLAIAQLVVFPTSFYPIGERAIVRVAGPLEGPNQLAGYLGLALPMLAAALSFGRAHWTTAVALGLGSLALVLTLSRAGILATALAVTLAIWLGSHNRVRVSAVAAGAAAAGAIVLGIESFWAAHSAAALSHVVSNGEVQRSGGVGRRTQLWRGALALWREHPVFGIGAGNYEGEIGGVVGDPAIRTHANSWYLQSLVEGGIPLIVATAFLAAAAILVFVADARRHWLVGGTLAAGAGFVLHQATDYLVFYPKVGTLWFILLGIGAAAAMLLGSGDLRTETR